MIEDTTVYEYLVPPHAPHCILVRAKRDHSGRGGGYKVYMYCDSPHDAERILALLVSDQTIEGVIRE